MNSYEVKQKLLKAYSRKNYYTDTQKADRRRANKRYCSMEENKEAKRQYMKEYAKRPYVKAKAKKKYKNRKDWWKAYYQRPHVKAKMKAYAKKYNKRPSVKIKRHEWYINKLIKENDKLHAENSTRFTHYNG